MYTPENIIQLTQEELLRRVGVRYNTLDTVALRTILATRLSSEGLLQDDTKQETWSRLSTVESIPNEVIRILLQNTVDIEVIESIRNVLSIFTTELLNEMKENTDIEL